MNKDLLMEQYMDMGISPRVYNYCIEQEDKVKDIFEKYDNICEFNQLKVINAMQQERISTDMHFAGSTGYGFDDSGRDALDRVFARIFHTEDALVRQQLISGTNSLYIALSAITRQGDEILSPVGMVYDSLQPVIGIKEAPCSLAEIGVTFKSVDMLPDKSFDYEGIKNAISERTKIIEIQRSKGYATRPTLSIAQIGDLISFIKGIKPDVIVMVDNCYGEFTEEREPSEVGADLIVGSLIKNPGGGYAPIGGYICGRKDLIDRCSCRLTAPALYKEIGASLNMNRTYYQGIFSSPSVTANALKGTVLCAAVYEGLGFETIPRYNEQRDDIVECIILRSEEAMMAFAKGIQEAAPVDSFLTPVPENYAGYPDPVVMAAGTFVLGSTVELSADGPLREPYAIYFQGGLTYHHAKLGVMKALQNLIEKSIVEW